MPSRITGALLVVVAHRVVVAEPHSAKEALRDDLLVVASAGIAAFFVFHSGSLLLAAERVAWAKSSMARRMCASPPLKMAAARLAQATESQGVSFGIASSPSRHLSL